MKARHIIIGARGSLLSVAQTESVIRSLKLTYPECSFTLKTITTLGDRVKKWNYSDTGIFVKEIEDALKKRIIDAAVHSVKDLPSSIPEGLALAAVTKRADPRDVFISHKARDLFSLEPSSVIGTSSLRRQAQILHVRPDLRVCELRGNLDTRIRKLKDGFYDAIVVAKAGLQRLHLKKIPAYPISETIMLPQTGQGALGIEIRRTDAFMKRIVKCLDDRRTHVCVECERAFLRETKAGCRMPVASYAEVAGNKICLEAMIIDLKGVHMIRLRASAPLPQARWLGMSLARKVLREGGAEILKEIRNAQA